MTRRQRLASLRLALIVICGSNAVMAVVRSDAFTAACASLTLGATLGSYLHERWVA